MPARFQRPPSPAEPIVCSVDIEVMTPNAHPEGSDEEYNAGPDSLVDVRDWKEYSRRRFALQTRTNVLSWELNNVIREIEDTERYISKLRRELAKLDPTDDSGHALAHLDFYTIELVEQRKELKELDAKRRTLEVMLQDIATRARDLQQRRESLNSTSSPSVPA